MGFMKYSSQKETLVLLMTEVDKQDPGPRKERVGRKKEGEKGEENLLQCFKEVKRSNRFSWHMGKDGICLACDDASIPVAVTNKDETPLRGNRRRSKLFSPLYIGDTLKGEAD